MGVFGGVIEFFLPVGVTHITPVTVALGIGLPGRIIVIGPLVERRKRCFRTIPATLLWISEKGLEGVPIKGAPLRVEPGIGRQPTQIEKSGIEIHKGDRQRAGLTRLTHPGSTDNQGHPGGLLPERILVEIVLLPHSPAVVGSENDDRVVLQRGGLNNLQDLSHKVIDTGYRGEIGLDELTQSQLPIPLERLNKGGIHLMPSIVGAVITAWSEGMLEGVLYVPEADLRKLDGLEGKEVEVFPGNDQRSVRTNKPKAHQEGLPGNRQFTEFLDRPSRIKFVRGRVTVVFRLILQLALARPVSGAPRKAGSLQIPEGPEGPVHRPEVVPEGDWDIRVGHVGLFPIIGKGPVVGEITKFRPLIPSPVVHHLTSAKGMVAVVPEMGHQGPRIPQHFVAVPVIETVAPRGVRVETSEETGPRWVADWDVAMSLSKRNPGLNQATNVGCPSLRMTSKGFNVIVQVITNDEKHVLLVFRGGLRSRKEDARKSEKSEQDTHGFPLGEGASKGLDRQREIALVPQSASKGPCFREHDCPLMPPIALSADC